MKKRIFITLIFSLLVTVLFVWLVVGFGMFRPLRKKMLDSRADIVATVASEVERAAFPKRRVVEFEEKLHLEISIRKRKPKVPRKAVRRVIEIERAGYKIFSTRGPHAPMVAEIHIKGETFYLAVRFPPDLHEVESQSRQGLLIVFIIVGLVGWFLSRWMFEPLKKASLAMEQIAEGNFSHRVTDDIGPAKDAFNVMANKVQTLIFGQRQLIASISHELRTPLTRLRLQTEILEGEISSDKLRSINQDLDELDELVEIMLLSAKMEQEKLALRLRQVSISALVLDGLGKVELGDRYLKLDIEPGLEVLADRTLLFRIVLNLLSNIGRYTPNDCTVSISAKNKNDIVEFVVSDTGYGVSDNFLTEIFEPFSREEASRARRTGGWGLGLGFVKNVVELHQGTIGIEHNMPRGLLVRIVLPQKSSLRKI